MPIEFEAKFLNIDRDQLRHKLAQNGFICAQPDYLMQRTVFTVPNTTENCWARVRDEAGQITITFKKTFDANAIDGTEEIEIKTDDFARACQLLTALGLQQKAYQETRREVWRYGGITSGDLCDVTLDEWPALPPFCEIEAANAELVRKVASDLGFQWKDALFGPVSLVYERELYIAQTDINHAPLVTFDTIEEIKKLSEIRPLPDQSLGTIVADKHLADCVILTKDHKLYMQQRPNNWGTYAGRVNIFGGHVEHNETPTQGVIREVLEETGGRIIPNDLVFIGAVTERSTAHREIVHIYFWHDAEGTITGCYEAEPIIFETLSEALAHPKLMPYARWALKAAENRKLLPEDICK